MVKIILERSGHLQISLIEYFTKAWQGPGRNGPALAGRRKPCTVLVQGKHRPGYVALN
jgi:hypothetical protein